MMVSTSTQSNRSDLSKSRKKMSLLSSDISTLTYPIETHSDTENSKQGIISDQFKEPRASNGIFESFHDIPPNQTEKENELRKVFSKAKKYINPGFLTSLFIHIYANRAIFIPFALHFISTMTIWGHFAMIKYTEQMMRVPLNAPNYWWKRLVPSIEFGSMHAILFQMALIPLTMSRYSISALSHSTLNRFIPMNKMLAMHIHLGYTFVTMIFLSTVVFFIFFGKLCADGEQAFCEKMTSEIMVTGYSILGTLLIIGGTSYFRNKMPYELFYIIHHLVFVMYLITIIHTFDRVQRSGERDRSQTFKWFSAPLLYYIADRSAMYLMHKYTTKLESYSRVMSSDGSKMLTLKMLRPSLFFFKPGQYVFLRANSIDRYWHPFSIASSPSSTYLEFYIEVFDEGTWTHKLWKEIGYSDDRMIEFEIMGPYGTSLAKTNDFTHGLAIGTGTGIVPILSLFRQYVNILLQLSPETHLKNIQMQDNLKNIEVSERNILDIINSRENKKGSIVSKLFSWKDRGLKKSSTDKPQSSIEIFHAMIKNHAPSDEYLSWNDVRNNEKRINKMAFNATKLIYGKMAQAFMTAMSAFLLSFTVSWNLLPETISFKFEDHPIDFDIGPMISFLNYFMIAIHSCFIIFALFVWDLHQLMGFIDFMFAIITPFADWYYFKQYESNGSLTPTEVISFCIITGYMTVRYWNAALKSPGSHLHQIGRDSNLIYLESLKMIWVTRSAHLVLKIGPDINNLWCELAQAWGHENANKACPISIYVTDKDERAKEKLFTEFGGTELFLSGAVKFGRPNFGKIIEDHNIHLASEKEISNTFLTFCGSPKLSNEISKLKISNDLLKTMLGYKKHLMEFYSESYGGLKKAPANSSTPEINSMLSQEDIENEANLNKSTSL